jgi:transmembrane sensor
MNRDQFLKSLSRKLSPGLTEPEQQRFDAACREHDLYARLAEEFLRSEPEDNGQVQAALAKVWQQIGVSPAAEPVKPSVVHMWFKVAAAILVMIGAALFVYKLQKPQVAAPADLALAATTQKVFKTLEDGTTVYLNRNARITYNTAFGQAKREISLQGEAFFDVAKNPKVPLHIQAGSITITVKGTAFNVAQTSGEVAISLVRGHLLVVNADRKGVALNANQRLVAAGHTLRIFVLDTTLKASATSWTRDSLVFKKEKLANLAVLLEKKYAVRIEIKNEKLKHKQFSGVIKKEALNEVLEALKLSYPFSYVINNKVVTIK